MKKLMSVLALVIGAIVVMQPAQAQQLNVATGGKGNTYSQMFSEFSQACSHDVGLIETNTSGSVQNLDLLVGNKVNAAFVQSDVIYWRARTEDLGGIKTLAALHPEEVHFLAPLVSKATTGGVIGLGSKAVEFNTVKDLAGYKVGAVGGSFVTAQVIKLQGDIAYTVVEYPSNDALLAAVAKGDVQAALIVAGQPSPLIAAQTGSWKLISMAPDTVEKLKAVYRPATLNYSNIRMAGIPAVATDALFVTREYKTARFVYALSTARRCLLAHLDDLKESTGKHPKWQKVDPANKGKWPYYDLPSVPKMPGNF